MRIYAEPRSCNRRAISERWIYFISSVKACVIRRGRRLLAYANPASTLPGQQSFKRRATVSVKVCVWWKCLHSPSARSLRLRSALVAENMRPTQSKWSTYYSVNLRSKYKPGFSCRSTDSLFMTIVPLKLDYSVLGFMFAYINSCTVKEHPHKNGMNTITQSLKRQLEESNLGSLK